MKKILSFVFCLLLAANTVFAGGSLWQDPCQKQYGEPWAGFNQNTEYYWKTYDGLPTSITEPYTTGEIRQKFTAALPIIQFDVRFAALYDEYSTWLAANVNTPDADPARTEKWDPSKPYYQPNKYRACKAGTL